MSRSSGNVVVDRQLVDNIESYKKLICEQLANLGHSAKRAAEKVVLTACHDFLSGNISYDRLLEIKNHSPSPSFFSIRALCGVPTETEELVNDIVSFGVEWQSAMTKCSANAKNAR